MNEKKNFDYKRLHPFKWYILENFPFLEDSIDVLTNYQLFCKLGEMYNKEIDAINTLGVQVEGITDWFDDLDVQEEVDKKLDEMAESGELAEIIAQYIQLNGVLVYDTIAEMKNATNLVDGSVARTLGYYSINDGGKCLYKIREITNNDVVDECSIIALANENLIAELIFDNELNVKQFGVKGDGTTNDTLNIEKAINYVSEKHGTLYFPDGTYLIDYMIIKNNVNYRGNNQDKTILKASNNSLNHLISLSNGAIRNLIFENFSIICDIPSNSLIGIDLTASQSSETPYDGGVWYSSFKNLTISKFLIGLKLEAIDNQGDLANQFLTFDHVDIYRRGVNASERCLIANEQIGQTTFNTCLFESLDENSASYKLAVGIDIDINSTINVGSSNVNEIIFNNCTVQNSVDGVLVNGSAYFNNCWFENIGKAFTTYANAKLVVNGTRFANTGYMTDNSGYIIKGAIQAYIVAQNNTQAGRCDKFFDGTRNERTVEIYGNSLGTSNLSSTGTTVQTGVGSNGTLDVKGLDTITVGVSDTELKTISGVKTSQDTITILVWGGDNGNSLKINHTGNILLPSNAHKVFLHKYDTIVLKKIDLVDKWIIESSNIHKFYSPTIPSSNSSFNGTNFVAGDIIYNSNIATGQPEGWICTTSGAPGTWTPFGSIG